MTLQEILKSQGLSEEQIQKIVGEMKQNKIFTASEENLDGSYVTNFGSNWSNSDNTGTFYLNVNNSTSDSNGNVSAHLKFSKGSYCLLNPRCKSGV